MLQYKWIQTWKLRLIGSATLIWVITSSGNGAFAQSNLTPDTAPGRGLATRVEPLEPSVDQIRGGTRRGSSLFHSFSEFNIPEGRGVYFENPSGITNILSRVTGNDPSDILGTLGVGSPAAPGAANLFLINPNGIFFGEDARLDTRGSFLASTASSLQFNDWEFSATNPQAVPQLTVNVPIGLQFGRAPGRIINQAGMIDEGSELSGGLRVQPGNTLALVGGDVGLDGGVLVAPGGRVELGGVREPGQIGLDVNGNRFHLSFPSEVARANVSITDQSGVSLGGAEGGDIVINAHHLNVVEISRISGILPSENQTGNMRINSTGIVTILNSVLSTAGGDIIVQARSLLLEEAPRNSFPARITTETTTGRDAGDIRIEATDSIRVEGGTAQIIASSTSSRGGEIFVETRRLRIQGGGEIAAEAYSTGSAGTIIVRATDLVEVISDNSQLSTRTEGGSRGDAGNLTIETGRLIVQDGGLITASAGDDGQAGELNVTADIIHLRGTNSSLSSNGARDGSGSGGRVMITTRQLLVQDGAFVQVRSRGSGVAGDILITADSVRLERGELSAETEVGSGANIVLQISDSLLMSNQSQITARAFNNANGGNIVITSDRIVAPPFENSDIVASAVQGNGGIILITAQEVSGIEERSSMPGNRTNDIDASSEFGTSGTVVINSADLGVVELPATPVTTELSQACGNGSDPSTSRFVSSGRSGLPLNPYEPLSGSDVLADVQPPEQFAVSSNGSISNSDGNSSSDETLLSEQIVEAQGWRVDEQGRILLVAEATESIAPESCQIH